MTVEEFLAVIDDKLPPVPVTLLDEFEAEIGRKLPEDYRNFLIQCNGGYAAGSVVFRGPTPEGLPADACPNHIGGFRGENHFSLKWARLCYQSEEELRIPKALLWIMDDPFGNAICMGLSGKHRGQVYFWDHESEPDPETWDGDIDTAGNIERLAASFNDFVAGLRRFDETPDQAVGDSKAKPWWMFW